MGSTIWQAPSMSTGQAVLIGPRPPKMPDWISFDQSMLNVMLSKLLGMDASSLAGIRPLELGSEALRERYLILGSQERDAQALLSAQSEQALLSWITSDEHGELPAVVFWQHGLQIKFRRAISDIQQLEQIVTLGEAMLEALNVDR
jgi:hypothetical protein